MGVVAAVQRFSASRLDPQRRATVRAQLAAGVAQLAQQDVPAAREVLLAAHEGARNSARLHTASHIGLLAAELMAGDLAASARAVPDVALAGPASWVRRFAGLDPDAPTLSSLRETWRARVQ